MKQILKLLTLLALILNSEYLSAQINIKDSTAQAVGYWSKQEIQKFKVVYNKLRIKEKDTIVDEKTTYNVDVKIIDSTANSYTIEWFYHDYNIETDNELLKKMNSIANDISVQFKTNEFGAFEEVVNWKEISKYINKGIKTLKKDIKITPQLKQAFKTIDHLYDSKESIEANAIKDILQYYSFHGSLFKLNEKLSGESLVNNNYGGDPFKSTLEISLDEIDTENDTYVLRMKNSINSKQLTDETYKYLKKLGILGENLPKRENFSSLSNETYTASRIHGGSGWVTYSLESKEIKSDGIIKVEERTIELQ